MNNKHGQTEKISRRHENSGFESKRASLESIRSDRPGFGADEIITGGEDSHRRSTDWKLTPVRDTTAGKILERLESLETKYLEYVDSHQARLKARLEESKEDKQDFLQESNQIKSDIYHLAVAQQQANGNGHIN